MSVNADDLPPAVRRQLGLPGKARTRPAPSKAGIGHAEPTPGHCACTRPFPSYAAWERHARETRCRHWRIDLPTEPSSTRTSP